MAGQSTTQFGLDDLKNDLRISGILSMPAGRRLAVLLQSFEYVLNEKIQGRIAVFDAGAAQRCSSNDASCCG